MKLNFSKKNLAALEPDPLKRRSYYDQKKRGLILTVFPSGIKSFYLYRRVEGKPERMLIGCFPAISLEQARQATDILNAQIAQGINPNKAKNVITSELTFGELFNNYLERHAKPHKRSWKSDEDQFNLYLSSWSHLKLSAISKTEVQKFHLRIGEAHGRYSANRVLALVSTIFNKAIEYGWNAQNPATGVKKFKELSRDRFLQAEELPRFFEALDEEPNETAKDYILMSLLTGARKTNVLTMKWEDINFDQSTWTIPMTKNGTPHTLPLVPAAIELLQARKNNSIWVFPGSGKRGHFADPKKAWLRILERAQIKNLRLHDLRRSLGSWQAATGASLTVIGKTLAHKNVSTTAIYARLNIDPVREAMNKATDAMLSYSVAK